MHASSYENMARCHARYLAGDGRTDQRIVVDVGGADVNGGYGPIFGGERFRYLTVDLSAGEGVDIVLEDPYHLPFEDASVDVVLSGQMLEHCEFFWQSFAEMMRVLKPDGLLFLIAPSAGPIHRYPVDCYRFYPDAYQALARYAGCHLVEHWLDERGPWRDLVGVFSRTGRTPPGVAPPSLPPVPTEVQAGSADEEAIAGSQGYLDWLGRAHEALQPELYLEIGVRRGASLALARGPAIGVDPQPEVDAGRLPATTQLFRLESDEYFRGLGTDAQLRPDLAFIDGMHLFEFVLRDFMHIERIAAPGALVVVDDVFPSHPLQASRERRTRVWTGDVWKFRDCLATARPDLVLVPLDTSPTGLLLVAGLDPRNRTLWDRYNPLVRQYLEAGDPPADVLRRHGVLSPDDPRIDALLAVLRSCRGGNLAPRAIAAAARSALAQGAA